MRTPERKNPTVLVTAAGGAGTVDIIRSLRDTGRYIVIAVDPNPYAAGFAFADRSLTVPFAVDPAFEEVITEILERERPNFVVTTVDEEIAVFQRLARTRFREMVITAPRPSFVHTMLDKWTAMKALRKAGLNVPHTWLASRPDGVVFPAIVKPRAARGSRGFAHLQHEEELTRYLAVADGSPDDYVIQERLSGAEYTVSAVVGIGGPLLAVVPKEVLVKEGVTKIGVTRNVPAIDEACRQIQEVLRADGPFNVQLMLAEDGVPYIFEVNPRFSTTTALTIAAGLNEVDIVLEHAQGREVGPLQYQTGLTLIRYTAALYVDEAEWQTKTAV